jgi:site-specific DNA-methyltransferase (adenine-specific)
MSGQVSYTQRDRNPDALACVVNLSNDGIFTPPGVAC